MAEKFFQNKDSNTFSSCLSLYFFPSQDGPVHIANATILHEFLFNK